MTGMNEWIRDSINPGRAGIVSVDYVKAYGKTVLKEIRHGNFSHFEQAMSLMEDESKAVHNATMRSLRWAYEKAYEARNQEIMDRILPFLVLEAL